MESTIIEKAHELGFADAGFTSADAFATQRRILEEREGAYGWAMAAGLDLKAGTDPRTVMPEARTIIVLLEAYFRAAFPKTLEPFFGRCYLDDDRVTKESLAPRIRAFRDFLKAEGIRSKVPFNLPHRLAAARAGMGTFGKNCLFYASRAVRQSSWVLPIAVVVDVELAPGESTARLGCPDWCRNVCIAACPTGALKAPRKIDPQLCISYLTYYGAGITPRELREPMGLWVYGCDHCQNVCPRNAPWLAAELPMNERVMKKAKDFELPRLLHMDGPYFERQIWPHMFYMGTEDIWRWRMNVARSMGNSLDEGYAADLARAFRENADERVRGMCAWALGRIGGRRARQYLEGFRPAVEGMVAGEVHQALEECG
jgi:epoxyqueuosine reductase